MSKIRRGARAAKLTSSDDLSVDHFVNIVREMAESGQYSFKVCRSFVLSICHPAGLQDVM